MNQNLRKIMKALGALSAQSLTLKDAFLIAGAACALAFFVAVTYVGMFSRP